MHVINFLITILMPFIGLFYLLAPPDSIPIFFQSDAAKLLAGEFYVVVMFWAGLFRNAVDRGQITDRQYFGLLFAVLIFMCVSQIVLALPYTWIISIFAFGLGTLSATRGQFLSKKSLFVMAVISLCILIYTGYMLIGLAWFDFNPADHEAYSRKAGVLLSSWFD